MINNIQSADFAHGAAAASVDLLNGAAPCCDVMVAVAAPNQSFTAPRELEVIDATISEEHFGEEDHATGIVPQSERRGPMTLGLLWITMVTGFPTVLIGFDWFREGLSLGQVLQSLAVSCVLLMMYSIPACLLGAKTGQTYSVLARNVFGKWGSRVVSFNLIWLCVAWYGLNAVFLADGLKGLFGWTIPTAVLAAGLAVAMSFNNLFGFAGVANFARFLAAPVLILWVAIVFGKSMGSFSPSLLTMPSHHPMTATLMTVSSFIIGYGVWGNEADYWRYSKAKISSIAIPWMVSVLIGLVVFPITGWLIAHNTGITSYGAATNFMNQYAFGGVSIIAAIVLTVAYFAVNDSGLYGAINAQENIMELPRRRVVFGLMLAGVIATIFLATRKDAFELVASTSCVVLPSATVIVLAEWLLSKLSGRGSEFTRLVPQELLPRCKWPALIALLCGCSVGIATSGIIPALSNLHVGIASLQAWLTAMIVYLSLRTLSAVVNSARERRLSSHQHQPESREPQPTARS